MSNTVRIKSFAIMILLITSLWYSSPIVSGENVCPPEIRMPDPVLFSITPYAFNGTLLLDMGVYYFYQPYEGMCPISSETDRLECLDADALDFDVHYMVEGRNITGRLGEAQGLPLNTYPVNLTNNTVVININGSKVSFPFDLLRGYLSSLNVSGMLADNIYSDDLKSLVVRFNISGVVDRMRAFSYGSRVYIYFPQVQLVDCREFIPERFHVGGRYVSPIIPLTFNSSTPEIPPLVLEYTNGSLRPLLTLEPVKRKGDSGWYYYDCALPNLELPRGERPPFEPADGRNYTYAEVAPKEVKVSMNGFTNGTFALFLMNLRASGTLIPGGPNVPADISYTLLFGYDNGPFQIDLEPILRQFKPPKEDDHGSPVFHFGGADDRVFHLSVAFINGKPYLGVHLGDSENITLIRLIPDKDEWVNEGSMSLKRWNELAVKSLRGKRFANVSAHSKYFLSVPPLEYISVDGEAFVYPAEYSVEFNRLPPGYARVGKRIVPTCSIWPVYSLLSNGTVYGLFRVQSRFTIYPKLVEYKEVSFKTNTLTNSESTPSNKTTESTGERQKSICGPGIIVLLALLAIRER